MSEAKNDSSAAAAAPIAPVQAASAALDAAKRIVDAVTFPPKRPTIAELEAILARADGPPVHIKPDGSIGVGESDALIVARAFLAAVTEAERKAAREMLKALERIAAPSNHAVHSVLDAKQRITELERIAHAAIAAAHAAGIKSEG